VEEIVNVSLADLLAAGVPESATWNVRGVLVTVCVGVPVIAPVEAFNVRPAGSVPLVSDHISAECPRWQPRPHYKRHRSGRLTEKKLKSRARPGEGRQFYPNLSRRRRLEGLELLIELWPETSFA
jgi:hypothetical protein